MRTLQMLSFEETILAVKGTWANAMADAVIHCITKHCSHKEQPEEPAHLQVALGSKGASGKQQRIAGQERRDHHTSFQKDDKKQDQIGPYPILLDGVAEVRIEMQKEIDQMGHHIPLLPQTIRHINDYTGSLKALLSKQ